MLRILSLDVMKIRDRSGGGCLRVSVLTFYSDDTSLNPAGYQKCQCEKTKIIEKEAGVGKVKKDSPIV